MVKAEIRRLVAGEEAILVKSRTGQKPYWSKAVVVKSHTGQKPYWSKAILVKSHTGRKPAGVGQTD